MDPRTIENRIQAAYELGVREGREEGLREGVSLTLHRQQMSVDRTLRGRCDNVVPLRSR